MSTIENNNHAVLSPSSSNRWLNCTVSARLEEKIKEEPSAYAEEGTKAHELGATYIDYKKGNIPKSILLLKEKECPIEMSNYAEEYANYVLSLDNILLLKVEQEIDLSKYVPESFGTSDAFAIVRDQLNNQNILHVIDFKYGVGVKVSAVKNTQLMTYAVGILDSYDFLFNIKKIILHIYQPRIKNISVYEMSKNELITLAINELIPKAKQAFNGIGEFKCGDWCKFCKYKNLCSERFKKHLNILEKFKK